MVNLEFIERLRNGVELEGAEGNMIKFRIPSEYDEGSFYRATWDPGEPSIHKAFTCTCEEWKDGSLADGLCKHTIALCKKLAEDNSVPLYWFQEAMAEAEINGA